MDKITGLRRKIDKADEQIISLLKERLDIAVKINDLKQKHGQQALDAKGNVIDTALNQKAIEEMKKVLSIVPDDQQAKDALKSWGAE